jgi:hypothetical protein
MAYADTLKDLATVNTVKAETTDFDESKGVAGRVGAITSSASPLMQTARTRAQQASASRGLLNSSIAGQAGEQAVIETATPIANADAGLYQQQSLTNQAARNNANQQNAQNALSAGIEGTRLDVNQNQFGRSLMEQARQFDTSTTARANEFGVTSGQSQQQIDAQKAQQAAQLAEQGRQFDASRTDNVAMFDKELGEKARQFGLTQQQQTALAQMDQSTKLQLAEVEAGYKADIQSNTNIANAWGTTMQGISAIQTDPNLDSATKATLINNSLDSFKAFSSFWKKATGGGADVSDLLNFGVPGGGGVDNGSGASGQPRTTDEITRLYREVLGRDPDQGGLQTYRNSGMSVDDIRQVLMNSAEYRARNPIPGGDGGNG